MVYFICGHRGSGKSYLAYQVRDALDCKLFDTGPIVRKAHKDCSNGLKFSEWIEKGEKEFGKDFTNQIICNNIEISSNDINIIIGNRALQGINYIIDYFGIEDYKICFIDGDYELFRNNYNSRESLNFNETEFNQIMELEKLRGIEEIKKFTIDNPEKGIYYYKKQNDETILNLIIDDIKMKNKVLKK